jgi:hypothetical protein
MQIMPDTWAGLRQRYRLGRDPYDPHDNILAGAAYLREMHDRYGTARPLPAETLAYVAALAPLVSGDPVNRGLVSAGGPAAWTSAPLLVNRSTSSAYRPQSDDRPRISPVTDLSGLEPSFGRLLHGKPRAASLFVARTCSCPPR